jgi:hypothetical protein
MITRHIGQSMRFILGAVAACALVACAENAFLQPVQPAAAKDACEEAAEYSRRAAAANDEKVRAGLQKIADTKSHDCAAKTSVSAGHNQPSASASDSTSQ